LNFFLKILLVGLIVFSATSCYKQDGYTAPYPTPPPGYYDYVTLGTVYNNSLVIAGGFDSLYGDSKFIAQWNGSSWQRLGDGPGFLPVTMIVYDNNLYVGGTIFSPHLGHICEIEEWDGTTWQVPGGGLIPYTWYYWDYNSVNAFTVYNNNLIVGGLFYSAGGQTVRNIAQWNGASWASLNSGSNGVIQALTVYNGALIAGGNFDSIGGQHIVNIAQWNGTSWSPLSTQNFNGEVYSLFTYNNNLFAAGYFTKIGSTPVNGMAEWNGNFWQNVNAPGSEVIFYINFGLLANPTVYSGNLYFGYNYDSVLVQLSSNGTVSNPVIASNNKETWSDQHQVLTNLYPLCIYNGNLIISGWFTSANGVTVTNNIAQWNGTSLVTFP
jgi:hypothetical protein